MKRGRDGQSVTADLGVGREEEWYKQEFDERILTRYMNELREKIPVQEYFARGGSDKENWRWGYDPEAGSGMIEITRIGEK